MMTVENFDIEFKFKGILQKASCQQYQVHNYPQIRVAVDRGRKDCAVYIFYDVKGKDNRFFWYSLPEPKQEIAKIIAKQLEKILG